MPKGAAEKSQTRTTTCTTVQRHIRCYSDPLSSSSHIRRHQLANDAACKEFQALSKERVILQTNELDIGIRQYIKITDETWNEVESEVVFVKSLLVVELMAPPQEQHVYNYNADC